MNIVVAGTFAGTPGQGGATWAVLQYVLGLRALGHDVLLVEPTANDPAVIAYFERVVRCAGLQRDAALLHTGDVTSGLPIETVRARMASADVLLNLAGVLADHDLMAAVPLRVYIDLDPAFTQLWSEVEGIDMNFDGHHRHVTVGLAVGRPGCAVPTCGVEWLTTVPPIVLDRWPAALAGPTFGLTTVGNWRSYGSVTYGGVQYGQKAHSVRALLDLPSLVDGPRVEPAFGIDPAEAADLDALAASGWTIHEPAQVASTPEAYRSFVASSMAEIGISKSGYVRSRCGWFSDRSVCYLASARPVIAQDTGWSEYLPHGEGLMKFDDTSDAARAVAAVLDNYPGHCAAARRIAEQHFDASKVLPNLLRIVGASS